jgi:hypothetical protein
MGSKVWSVMVLAVALCGACNREDVMASNQQTIRVKIGQSPVAVPGNGSSVVRSPPPPGQPVLADTASFVDLVLERRKVGDPMPWIEPVERQFSNGDPAGTVRDVPASFNQFTMLAESLVGVGGRRHNTPDSAFNFDVMHEFGPSATSVPEFIRDRMAFGTGYADWNEYPGGLVLPMGLQQLVKFRAVDAVPAAPDDVFGFAAWRGYRMWPKGAIRPVQRTYQELAREHFRLEPYSRAVSLTVKTDTTEAAGTLAFTEDYVVDGVSVFYPDAAGAEFSHWGVSAPFVQLKIEPNATPLMDKWVSLPLVGWNLRRTSWNFRAVPLTVDSNTVWTIKAKTRVAGPFLDGGGGATLGPIQVVVYGAKLHPPQ